MEKKMNMKMKMKLIIILIIRIKLKNIIKKNQQDKTMMTIIRKMMKNIMIII